MSAHTPGPWFIKHGFNIMGPDVRYPGEERSVATAGGHTNNQHNEAVTAENEANARLIAAAPELLEALRHMGACRSCNEGSWEDCDGGRAASAAIAKAEGRP